MYDEADNTGRGTACQAADRLRGEIAGAKAGEAQPFRDALVAQYRGRGQEEARRFDAARTSGREGEPGPLMAAVLARLDDAA